MHFKCNRYYLTTKATDNNFLDLTLTVIVEKNKTTVISENEAYLPNNTTTNPNIPPIPF